MRRAPSCGFAVGVTWSVCTEVDSVSFGSCRVLSDPGSSSSQRSFLMGKCSPRPQEFSFKDPRCELLVREHERRELLRRCGVQDIPLTQDLERPTEVAGVEFAV